MTTREHKGQSLIECVNDYIVIDLETTGLDPACNEIIEIAAIKVSDGKVIERYNTLVKPQNEVNEFITELTGITNEMLIDAPMFESVLPSLAEFLDGAILVGHNVNFDINFLYDKLITYGGVLVNNFIDTMRLSRRLFNNFENHKLATLVKNFNIDTIPTHRALADCEATLTCYEYIKRYIASNGIELKDLMSQRSATFRSADIAASVTEFDESHPLYGKVCVFTGVLSFTRKEAMQLVANVGGINADGINKHTNYLIIGNNEYCTQIKDGKSNKQKKAEEYKLTGQDITILSEAVFIDLLKDSQIKASLPIPENQMPAAHFTYASAISQVLKEAGIDTEYLRFSVDGDRLDVLCCWLLCRIIIRKKNTYITLSKKVFGQVKYKGFLAMCPNAEAIELSNEYRIMLRDPSDIGTFSEGVIKLWEIALETVKTDLYYHPSAEQNHKNYLNNKNLYKV